jgi:hypothetical protein
MKKVTLSISLRGLNQLQDSLLFDFISSRFYTVVAPNSFRANSKYHLSLATLGLSDPMGMKITLKGSQYFQEKQVTVMPNAPQVAYLDVCIFYLQVLNQINS